MNLIFITQLQLPIFTLEPKLEHKKQQQKNTDNLTFL